jgi:hypothetical protein
MDLINILRQDESFSIEALFEGIPDDPISCELRLAIKQGLCECICSLDQGVCSEPTDRIYEFLIEFCRSLESPMTAIYEEAFGSALVACNLRLYEIYDCVIVGAAQWYLKTMEDACS